MSIAPLQNVPGNFASSSSGFFTSDTSTALPGAGQGPSPVVSAVNPMDATNLISNPDTITQFDPFNLQIGIPSERSSSLSTDFQYPSEFTEIFENTTNQVGTTDLTNQREPVTFILGNTKDFGEPYKGSAMFIEVRPSQPVPMSGGKTIQTQVVYSLQQLNYILAVESANAQAGGVMDMEVEGDGMLETAAFQYRFIGFFEGMQPVLRSKYRAVVICTSGTYDEIPPMWPGRVRKGDYLGFLLNWVDASEIVGGKYTFSEGKSKIMPPHANKILQIRPVVFGHTKVLDPSQTAAFDDCQNYCVGKQLCIGMALNEIYFAESHTKASFYDAGSSYSKAFHEITFQCGALV